MLAGVSKKTITPGAGIDLAGFGRLDRKNIGVHDDIYVTSLALKQAGKCVLIVCADIIGFGFQLTRDLKNKINKKYGISDDEILLNASHTHSGPQTLENMLVTLGKPNEEYINHFKDCVLASVDETLSTMEEVSVYYGKTECNFGVNRRLIIDGKAQFMPNDEGPADNDITVLKFMKGDSVKAVLFNYTCHPSTIGADYVSADYPGEARKLIEKELGADNGTVALFIQGCCGNIRTRTVDGNKFRSGTWDDVKNFGIELGSSVVKLCKDEMKEFVEENAESSDSSTISTDIEYLELPFKSINTKEELQEIAENGNIHEKLWAENMLANYSTVRDTLTFTIQKMQLNPEFSIIAMGGEVVVEYGLYAKNAAPEKTIIAAAYSNGLAGYITTDIMFQQGGYEPDGSTIYYLYPSQIDASIEKPICDVLDKFVK